MAVRDIEVVEISGTPRERGRMHGEACRTQIREFVERWKDLLRTRFSLAPDEFIARFCRETDFFGAIDRWTPGLLDEVRGVSEGCGLDFPTTFILSCYDEVWWFIRYYPLPAPTDAAARCTALGVFGQPGLPPIIGQNMDVGTVYDGAQVLLRIKHADGTPDALVFTFAGCVAMNGLNDRSIGICANTLVELDSARDGLPVAFVHRGVLAQPTYERAVRFCQGVQHASGQNYTIGGPERVIDLECSANQVREFAPSPGLDRVFHTNHALVNDDQGMFRKHLAGLAAEDAERMQVLRSNTQCRYDTTERMVMDPSKTITADDVKAVLRSHEQPWPVCVHNDHAFSSGSMVMVLSTPPTLHLTFGPACEQDYRVFGF
jgi:isopenicillin-N N-acyltransferase like protein